ncbi:MAG: BrnA antitoxin family protein [Desulfovibrio sp.]|nr:BrnA antitoxin family protein [Desulfovibrio sp.]MBI4961305.1 BrnA antitoxin family protein [Desulfovibrio sp.]
MKKKDRKRVSKDGLELAAPPEASGPSGEANESKPRMRARRGEAGNISGSSAGGKPGGEFPGIEDLAGQIRPRPKRVMISIRLDAEVLNWYRSIGKGYQSYIGELLAAWKRQQEAQAHTLAGDAPLPGRHTRKRTTKTPDKPPAGKAGS